MRTIRNSIISSVLCFAMVVVGYYFYRKGLEHRDGYSILRAPVDLISEIAGIFATDGDGAAPPPTPRPDPLVVPNPVPPTDSTPTQFRAEGRQHYLAGDYALAIPLLTRANSAELLSRARLFSALLSTVPDGSELSGPPLALISLAGGDPFLAELVNEDPKQLTFRRADGVGARVKKSELRNHRIARTHVEKKALAESEYKRRHAALTGAGDYLDLARFCRSFALSDHVTYLLERALDEPGDHLERAMFACWQKDHESDNDRRSGIALGLLKHFFRQGEYTSAAIRSTRIAPVRPSPAGTHPRPGSSTDGGPASGIGAVGTKTPRSDDPSVNALIDKADALRKDANDHYRLAQPGCEDRAMHRKKALAAYEEAIGLYEEVEDRWGVSLDRIFKEILERRYHLLKDTPVK